MEIEQKDYSWCDRCSECDYTSYDGILREISCGFDSIKLCRSCFEKLTNEMLKEIT